MALEKVFVCERTIERFRDGPLGSATDGYCQWLCDHDFTRDTTRNHISRLHHLNAYLKQQEINDYTGLTPDHIHMFLFDYLPKCKSSHSGAKHHWGVAFSVHRFMEYLQKTGLVDFSNHDEATYRLLLEDYIKWMRDVHYLAQGTLSLRRQCLVRFLLWLESDAAPEGLPTLSPDKIQTFFLDYCHGRGRSACRSMQAALRTFLRFCLVHGYIKRDLSKSVPTLRTYKLDTLPRSIADNEAQEILSSIDRKTDIGRRDYAIIQLLHTYGIRGGQIRALRLSDINWAQSQIHFAATKQGKEILQPLTDEVGGSLLDYLQHSRPQTLYHEVFLTSRAPYRPLRFSTTLSEIIVRNMKTAGLTGSRCGSHAFRHAFATRMLEQGNSLKSIADTLGHRCIRTTSIYTKVNFQALGKVALDWPEEVL